MSELTVVVSLSRCGRRNGFGWMLDQWCRWDVGPVSVEVSGGHGNLISWCRISGGQ